jgi:hypothetical protein
MDCDSFFGNDNDSYLREQVKPCSEPAQERHSSTVTKDSLAIPAR